MGRYPMRMLACLAALLVGACAPRMARQPAGGFAEPDLSARAAPGWAAGVPIQEPVFPADGPPGYLVNERWACRQEATFGSSRWSAGTNTEFAANAALHWLGRHQEADGHWDAKKNGGSQQADPGVTGLALLAFLSAGYTGGNCKFAENVHRAARWLAGKQAENGCIGAGFEGSEGKGVGYHHAICALALSEAYGITRDPKLREPVQKALDYSIKTHQGKDGGWRYAPGAAESDLSVTVWYVLQLKSAKLAGFKVEPEAFQKAYRFVESVTDKDGSARYQSRRDATPTMTAASLNCRFLMGLPRNDLSVTKSADALVKSLPCWEGARDADAADAAQNPKAATFYYWQLGTMAAFRMGGDHWKKWNEALKPTLLNNQRKGGPMDSSEQDVAGSWDPLGRFDAVGGRVYTTALGALLLSIYSEYLPIRREW